MENRPISSSRARRIKQLRRRQITVLILVVFIIGFGGFLISQATGSRNGEVQADEDSNNQEETALANGQGEDYTVDTTLDPVTSPPETGAEEDSLAQEEDDAEDTNDDDSTVGQDEDYIGPPNPMDEEPEIRKEDIHFEPMPFFENIQPVEAPMSYLALVNKTFQLADDFIPADLVVPQIRDSHGNINIGILMRQTASDAVEALFEASTQDGVMLTAISGFRCFETQDNIFQNMEAVFGLEEADRVSARAGHSEHQLGLALDVDRLHNPTGLTDAFAYTEEFRWLEENAHRFGFIISYPLGREWQTGFIFEPWHIRYVGAEAATVIWENNWILEEYLLWRSLVDE